MKNLLFILPFIFFVSCSTKQANRPPSKKFDLVLFYNGPTTLYKSGYDSSYRISLLPILNNLTHDTVTFIRSIYGRHDRPPEFNVYPKFGINLYQNNKKIDFTFFRGCSNWGFLSKEDFVTVYPNNLMLPFKDSYESNPNFDFTLNVKTFVKGEVEIEAYYNTLDTNQQNYHPFSDQEMKMNSTIVLDDWNSCSALFKMLPHVDLKSNRIKVILK